MKKNNVSEDMVSDGVVTFNNVVDTITFHLEGLSRPILELKPPGDIIVCGRKAENDLEVVNALRMFLSNTWKAVDFKKREVTEIDLWALLLSTVRYSMGRRTYMTSYAPELVKRYGQNLSKAQLIQIANEVAAELKRETNHSGYLGDSCDVDNWTKFEKDCRKMAERKEE